MTYGQVLGAGSYSSNSLAGPSIQATQSGMTLELEGGAQYGQPLGYGWLPLMFNGATQTTNQYGGLSNPWGNGDAAPLPAVIYAAASIGTVGYAQDGQSSLNYTGGVGGTVSVSLSDTTISLTQTIVTASAPFNGVTAVSLGGQASICCVYDQDANGNIDSGTVVLPRWDMTSVAYQGIGFSQGNYGSRVTDYGSNGRASNVNLDLDSSTINGSGQYIYGLVAASLGAATPIQTNLPGSGSWEENRDSVFGIRDPSDPGWYVDGNANPNNLAISYPGGSGDVSLTLSNKSAITLTGQNLVGVLATSASEPFFIPTNVTNFAYGVTQSGAVTVSIDATSSVSVKDANQAGVSFGVLAASTGGSGILPFSSGHVIQGDSVPVPFGVGRSGDVTVTSNGSSASQKCLIAIMPQCHLRRLRVGRLAPAN